MHIRVVVVWFSVVRFLVQNWPPPKTAHTVDPSTAPPCTLGLHAATAQGRGHDPCSVNVIINIVAIVGIDICITLATIITIVIVIVVSTVIVLLIVTIITSNRGRLPIHIITTIIPPPITIPTTADTNHINNQTKMHWHTEKTKRSGRKKQPRKKKKKNQHFDMPDV